MPRRKNKHSLLFFPAKAAAIAADKAAAIAAYRAVATNNNQIFTKIRLYFALTFAPIFSFSLSLLFSLSSLCLVLTEVNT